MTLAPRRAADRLGRPPYRRYRNVKLRREAIYRSGGPLQEQLAPPRTVPHRRRTPRTAPVPGAVPDRRATRPLARRVKLPSRDRAVGQLVQTLRPARQIRGSSDELATWVHPHLFRHHLGASLLNDGVPFPVIQRGLDHESLEMTAQYARLADQTLRREMLRGKNG